MANLPGGIGRGLGVASGAIRIDTSDLNRVEVESRRVGQQVERNLSRINSGAQQAQRGMANARDASLDFGRALGVAGGIAGAIQFGRFAIEADRLATSYRRQSVAALQLAGSQERLNAFLEAYERASGGAVDEATALSNVTRLMAVGFGDSEEEIERFTTAVRGASIAMNVAQAQMSQEVQLAISNQSLRRLDQIGLGITEVNNRIEELRANNEGMTREAAFQEAILGLLVEKYSALAESAEGQATGIERVNRAWRNQRLALGQLIGGITNVITIPLSSWLQRNADYAENLTRAFERLAAGARLYAQALNLIPRDLPASFSSRTGIGAGVREAPRAFDIPSRFSEQQEEVILAWDSARADIEDNANRARLDATEQYESQRTSTITRYGRTIAREAEDFARQRARAEQQLGRDIADVHEDSADRIVDINRQLSRRETDIQEQLADRQGDIRERLGEREADIREQVGKRLLDIEEDYQRNRERATRDHRDNLLDAASRLDARAIFEEQRRFKRQQEDLLEARDDQVEQAQEGADEQLEQARENADRQLDQAQETADDQLQQAREAAQEQLEQQRRQAEERIQELREEFEDRKREEDEDRAIRLQRMAEDHQDQLDEQARQHSVRLQQISDQEQEERELLDAEFQKSLAELELQTDAWIKEQERLTERAIENFDKWWEAVNRRFGIIPPPLPSTGGAARGLPEMSFQSGGFVPRDMVARLHAGEFVMPRHQVQNMGGISIIVQGGPGGEGTAIAVRNELESLLRSFGGV